MSKLLEITGDDIAELDDKQLRVLIGLLCEAELRNAGLPATDARWGGHQNAKDGGLDVVVQSSHDLPKNSTIPRRNAGFQVKATNMPPSKISKEIQDHPETIKKLIKKRGAYIIVSSKDSTSEEPALSSRLEAMSEAVKNVPNNQNLHLDFFDRNRVATWVRNYPSTILWVREKTGRPLHGWKSYGNWANPKSDKNEEYLIDNEVRLIDEKNQQISIQDGIQNLRTKLSTPGKSLRLVGLSGVGKTRLVQALFDSRIGNGALPHSEVIYTDIEFAPDPAPIHLAEQLYASNDRGILIIDNCSQEMHRSLTTVCTKRESLISLLTIEYDVRDDLPEETDVFRLEPSSEQLICKLITMTYPHIDATGALRIAEFSEGNARVALLLAEYLNKGEEISTLQYGALFKRLFYQQHGEDNSLLASGEVLSLVYSFEGTDIDSEKSEINFLATLAEKTAKALNRDIEALRKRHLIQSRNVWRALLPHAIANRLAKDALANLSGKSIVDALLNKGSERLIKSFSRRLSYLHDSPVAQEIVTDWLAPDGFLGKAECKFNDFEMKVFSNIAPVVPEKTLELLERNFGEGEETTYIEQSKDHRNEYLDIIRKIAYDEQLFCRCAELLGRLALGNLSVDKDSSSQEILGSFFFREHSGTHATVSQKSAILKQLLTASNPDKQILGFYLLDIALTGYSNHLAYKCSFGARKRDFGKQFNTREDVLLWYKTFIDLCASFAISDNQEVSVPARRLLAKHLCDLWMHCGMFAAITEAAVKIQAKKSWVEGWRAVRKTMHYYKCLANQDVPSELLELERALHPNNLVEQARAYVLSNMWNHFSLFDVESENDTEGIFLHKTAETVFTIAMQIADDENALAILLPEFLISDAESQQNWLLEFGEGLAAGCIDKNELWQKITSQLEKIPSEKRQINLLKGFLSRCAENDPQFYNLTMDAIVQSELLQKYFFYFQFTKIDSAGLQRIHSVLDRKAIDISTITDLQLKNAQQQLSDDDLVDILTKVRSFDNSLDAVVLILKSRFYYKKEAYSHSQRLVAFGREVLSELSFQQLTITEVYDLNHMMSAYFVGQENASVTQKMCRNIIKALNEFHISIVDCRELFQTITKIQPKAFLDVFIGNNELNRHDFQSMFSSYFLNNNHLNEISDEVLISWCDAAPEIRYPLLATALNPFTDKEQTGVFEWKTIFLHIINNAPDLVPVLDSMKKKIGSISYDNDDDRRQKLKKRSSLLQQLFNHKNEYVKTWAKEQDAYLLQEIEKNLTWIDAYPDRTNESFE